MHQINEPWRWQGNSQSYCFCDNPECNVVYFGQDVRRQLTCPLRVCGIRVKRVSVKFY